MGPELKVYAHVYPADHRLENALSKTLSCAITDAISEDMPLLCRDGDMLRISFEGRYFPEEEVIEALKAHLLPEAQGKVDVLDIAAWRMRRYFIKDGTISVREASLNNVLDYSGF